MKQTTSLAMIVKDEEEVLDRCLGSVKGLFDEIVIVDTGSTDRTKEIAAKYTDKIFDFKWIDDFSAARNYSFEMCSKEFVFWIDADDEIPPEEAEKIRTLDLSETDTVICPYLYYKNEETGRELIVPRERFLRRALKPRWHKRIHEYVSLQGRQTREDILVKHFRVHGTSERNIRLLELSVDVENPDPRDVYYLAKEYHDFGKVDEAIERYEQYVAMSGSFWEDVFTAWYRLAKCYKHKADEPNFKRAVYESMKMEPRRAEPYCLLGEWWMDRKSWERAIHWYKLASVTERSPELLSSFQTEFYTWHPHLQLCLCYNNIGDVKQAYEHNEKMLSYNPKDKRALNNRDILGRALKKKKPGEGKRLNLGCGGKPMKGYVNVDLYDGDTVDEVFDLYEIPYEDGTISAIHSEHALEHVGRSRTLDALREWFRVLSSGGELLLKMPDLTDCCKEYLAATDENRRLWYKYTIFGYQKSLSGEPDEAQIHRWGYSMEEMTALLEDVGFVVDYSARYDGWDTPSFAVRAVKPVNDIRVAWHSPVVVDSAQVRLRCLNVDRWLRSRGWRSKVEPNAEEIVKGNYDVVVVGKSFNETSLPVVKKFKDAGMRVFCDMCEDIVGWQYVNDVLKASEKVICCSRKLAEKVSKVNSNTVVIEEAWER